MSSVPSTSQTQAETFILESLNVDDEINQRMDGKVLFEVLKLQGKNPIYYYFRTRVELTKFAEIFRASGYRYLHLSCHGDEEVLQFTFGQTTYAEFAEIFGKKLNNRRLFISGCSLGNEDFAKSVFERSGGAYSVTAPIRKVFFSQTSSFWPAFYYMMHAWDAEAMKRQRLSHVLERLTEVFEMPMAHFFKNTAKKGAVDCQIFGGATVTEALVPAKMALPSNPDIF